MEDGQKDPTNISTLQIQELESILCRYKKGVEHHITNA